MLADSLPPATSAIGMHQQSCHIGLAIILDSNASMTSRAAVTASSFIMTKDAVVLDRPRLRDLTGGDAEFERELLGTYIASVKIMLGAACRSPGARCGSRCKGGS